ncbi:MAG: aminopeptidase, partial [Flavobacterium sp.]|nr:aminopeptidase [Flavobacterium sp.]
LNRNYVFTAFTGEELGLLGSAHYVKNPAFPLEKTGAMINMDMIGRLKDSALTLQGIGTSPIWKDIVSQENIDSTFKLKLGQDGFGSSDHASFTSKEIPVLFFFTGLHSDYHKPSDDWNLINYEGEKLVTDYVVRVIKNLDTLSEKPKYTKVEMTASQREGAQRGFRVSFGIMPDFGEDAQGLKISGTRANSPAEKAGLKSGDIIIKFGGKDIKNIYDLTYLLGEFKPGDEVDVIVLRGQDNITMKAKLEAR